MTHRWSHLGVTFGRRRRITTVPTHRDRIAVTKDPELAAALERVASLVPAGIKPATLVRDLAVRGAEAMIADRDDHDAAVERMIARTTAENPGFDRDTLADIHREAWDRQT
jgi:DnaJ-domain-containing protein 1